MVYCTNCGTEITEDARFCPNCGHPTGIPFDNRENYDNTARKVEFVGEIYKCPNCGEVLHSFEINCPACGFELRGIKKSKALREFSLKLESINSRGSYDKKRNFLTGLSKTDELKIDLIKSFSVPNSKEDLLEFMILATSSVDMEKYASGRQDKTNEAWMSMIQQIYEKSKLLFSPSDDTFNRIKTLYDDCNKKIKKSKSKPYYQLGMVYLGLFTLIIIIVVICKIIDIHTEKKELNRLENIVTEVQTALDNEEYKHALRLADSIDYQKDDAEMERKWDIQRSYWVDKVLDEAEKNGITLEYTPSPDIDKANKTDDEIPSEHSASDTIKENIAEFQRIINGEETEPMPNQD